MKTYFSDMCIYFY